MLTYVTLCHTTVILLHYMEIVIMVLPVGRITADKYHIPKEETWLPNMCDCHSNGHF